MITQANPATARAIRVLRATIGIRQGEFARITDLKPNTVSKLESERGPLTLEAAKKIEVATGCCAKDLMAGKTTHVLTRQPFEFEHYQQWTPRILLPVALTAENGAKAALIGEFSIKRSVICYQCEGDPEPSLDCLVCKGKGASIEEIPVEWPMIKAIYARAVEHFTKGQYIDEN